MGVLSKLSRHYTCYEVGHPWCSSCLGTIWFLLKAGGYECFKMYFSLYLISALVNRKSGSYYLKELLPEVLRSTAFLTTNGIVFMAGFCMWRQFCDFNYLSVGFLPSMLAASSAIVIESEPRRRLLAVYMANIAVESLYLMAKFRGWVKPLPYGETLLFCFVLASYLFLFRIGRCGKTMTSVFRYFIGNHEGSDNLNIRGKSASALAHTYSAWLKRLLGVTESNRASCCKHPHSCLQYITQAPIRPFLTGVGVQAFLSFVGAIRFVKQRAYHKAFQSLFAWKNLSLGGFLAAFATIFKFCQCFMRRTLKRDSGWHAALSGFLSGLSMLLYRSSSISLYLASKLCENFCVQACAAGYLPYIRYFDVLLYAVATSIVFHGVITEPHNIRPSYYKFLDQCSKGMFANINRRLLDEFGTYSSRLRPTYWPNYDPALTQLREEDYPVCK